MQVQGLTVSPPGVGCVGGVKGTVLSFVLLAPSHDPQLTSTNPERQACIGGGGTQRVQPGCCVELCNGGGGLTEVPNWVYVSTGQSHEGVIKLCVFVCVCVCVGLPCSS